MYRLYHIHRERAQVDFELVTTIELLTVIEVNEAARIKHAHRGGTVRIR